VSLSSPSHRRRARLIDRTAAGAISVGGGLILLATLLLVVFLVVESLPLIGGGSATNEATVRAGPPLALAEDEYRERVAVVGEDGLLHLVGHHGKEGHLALDGTEAPVIGALFSGDGQLLAVLDRSGRVGVFSLRQRVRWVGEDRVIEPELRALGGSESAGARLLAVAGSTSDATVLLRGQRGEPRALRLLDGEPSWRELQLTAPAEVGALTSDGVQAWVASSAQLAWYRLAEDSEGAAAALTPLPERPTAAAVLLGDSTLLLGDAGGAVSGWQALPAEPVGQWRLDRFARFSGEGAVRGLAPSQRNKAFAVLRPGRGEIRFLTSRRMVAIFPELPADVMELRLSPRGDGAVAATHDGAVHRFAVDLRHPEATFSTLFLPVRYEGYATADLVWQSTGGSAGFEPKLSLVPLIVGTFKGALYALLFSAPLALAGALYVNQFAPRRWRELVKPTVELMAAVPSVVVGFLAALFLAPLVREHLVFTLSSFALLPLVIVLAMAWSAAPASWRRRAEGGRELAVVLAVLAASMVLLYRLAPAIEGRLFGGDLETWLYSALGVTYDQRNALVVGVALGFAVIPIIFTIAEDAFSNVPPSLVAASYALGATRWQAARTVVVPAASPGLFAAVMLGFGRAVGETMIVLMATGNTPIMSLSPFNGMRTMSASIAVELPEAPFGGTLYRVLILTALLLFLSTFVINLVAAVVSERLRSRFGRLAG
jgi:phosphate transport system permease protein